MVFLALKEFLDLCLNNIVLMATDNTTVVAYITEGGDEVGPSVCPFVEVSDLMHQPLRLVSPVPDDQAWAVDTLSLSWENLDPYAFPPAAILGKVVEKLQDHLCNRIMLTSSQAPLMAIDQPLLTSWENPPLMSAKMRISLVSWIASTETDPRV